VVISCHLGLLMVLLRPAVFHRDTTPVVRNNPLVLKLRFLRPPQPSLPHSAWPAHLPVAPAGHGHATSSARLSEPPAVQQAAHADAQPSTTA
jgi:hypothetical protein